MRGAVTGSFPRRLPCGVAVLRLQRPVQRGPADAQVPGDRGHRLAPLAAGPGNGRQVIADGGRAAAAPALSLRGAQPPAAATAKPPKWRLEITADSGTAAAATESHNLTGA